VEQTLRALTSQSRKRWVVRVYIAKYGAAPLEKAWQQQIHESLNLMKLQFSHQLLPRLRVAPAAGDYLELFLRELFLQWFTMIYCLTLFSKDLKFVIHVKLK